MRRRGGLAGRVRRGPGRTRGEIVVIAFLFLSLSEPCPCTTAAMHDGGAGFLAPTCIPNEGLMKKLRLQGGRVVMGRSPSSSPATSMCAVAEMPTATMPRIGGEAISAGLRTASVDMHALKVELEAKKAAKRLKEALSMEGKKCDEVGLEPVVDLVSTVSSTVCASRCVRAHFLDCCNAIVFLSFAARWFGSIQIPQDDSAHCRQKKAFAPVSPNQPPFSCQPSLYITSI